MQGGNVGAERLRDSPELHALLETQRAGGKRWAAICASPAVVFQSKGWLDGKKATCHPAFVDKLADASEADTRVVVDGLLTTSRGPGTSFEFAPGACGAAVWQGKGGGGGQAHGAACRPGCRQGCSIGWDASTSFVFTYLWLAWSVLED